jgi:hypothetical protein
MTTKIHNYLALLASLIIVGFTIAIWCWLLWPYKPLEINELVHVVTKVVRPGEAVFVQFTFEKNTDVSPEISLALVDGVIFNIPTYQPQNPVGKTFNKMVGVLEIPMTVPCGTYHLQWTAKYKMNPIRVVEVKYESEQFEVVSPLCAE